MKNLNAVAMEFQDTFSADRNQHSSILQMQSANKLTNPALPFWRGICGVLRKGLNDVALLCLFSHSA